MEGKKERGENEGRGQKKGKGGKDAEREREGRGEWAQSRDSRKRVDVGEEGRGEVR